MSAKSLNRKRKYKKNDIIDSIIDIVIGEFRFNDSLRNSIDNISDVHLQKKLKSQYGWLEKTILNAANIADISIVDFTGKPYNPGMPVNPLNIEEFGIDENLVIQKTIEPVVFVDKKLRRTGTVLLESEK